MVSDAADRERISKKRVVGQLIQWKGKYGWIKPNVPIDHSANNKRGGKVYIGVEDMEGEVPVKSMVDFFVYVDDTGLGAMHCRAAPGAARPARADGGKGDGKRGGVIKTIQKQKGGGGKGAAGGKGQSGGKKPTPLKAKAKAKSKPDAKERTPPPAPDKTLRDRVQPKRVTGKLVRWRGAIGWIKPSEVIDHPEAEKHRGAIYLHQVDVQKGYEMFRGAQVTFFVYADSDGLGAEHVMLTKDQPAEAPKSGKAGGKGAKASKGKGKGGAGEPKKKTMVQKMQLKKRRSRGGKKKAEDGEGAEGGEKKEKEKDPKKGAKDLPRTRVTVMPVTGEVVDWRRNFGWLKPSEKIEHEKAAKDGKIWVHEKDVMAGAPLKKGQPVEFHVYSDDRGLGGEEVIALSS